MKAIIQSQFGAPELLQLKDVSRPTPRDHEVLIRVHASSVNAADLYITSGSPFMVRLMVGGLRKPKNPIPGADVAGQVEAVGRSVTRFKPGDAVFGDLSGSGLGAYADYVAAPETILAHKPERMSYEQAAALPLAGLTALQGLRDHGRLQAGQRVLVNGASGGVGSFAVQIAKAMGADVTAVCSTRKADMAHSLGADRVIDYTREDFTRSGERYDLIFDAAAYRPLADYRRSLAEGGVYLLVGGSIARIFQLMLLGPLFARGAKMKNYTAKPSADDLAFVAQLFEAGKVVPFIDACYPLADTARALRHVSGRQVQGKVVIVMDALAGR